MTILRINPERLQHRRVSQALSRLELGKAAGVHEETIGRLERGETGARLQTIRRLAAALGIEPLDIAGVEHG